MKKIVSYFFIFIVLFIFVTSLFLNNLITPVSNKINNFLYLSKTNQAIFEDEWNATTAFPFSDYQNSNESNSEKTNKFTNILINFIPYSKQFVERSFTEEYPYRIASVLLKKGWEKRVYSFDLTTSLLGDSENNSVKVISLENGNLHTLYEYNDDLNNVSCFVSFGKEMEDENRDFLLFIPPNKIEFTEISSNYNNIYQSFYQEKETELINFLEKNNIRYMKSDTIIKEANNGKNVFFQTDHHWKPQTALLACRDLTSYLNMNYGYNIDTSIYDIENYTISNSPYLWLGSQGKKVTEMYSNLEEFPIITPNYQTDYCVFISGINQTIKGNIQETLFDLQYISSDLYNNNQYGIYGYGDQPYIHIHNNEKNDGKRVLIIKKSFANTMIPFLGNIAEDVDVVDLRLFTGSLRNLLDQTDPDTVIFVYGVETFFKSLDADGNYAVRDPFDYR